MRSALPPWNERERLAKLRSYGVLDTETEASFDRITRIVADSIGVPISLVSLIDEDRQWFKSRHGLEAAETPRDVAFCAHSIHGEDIFVVPNATEDDRFRDNPLVTGDPNIRFYAGAPLVTPDGFKIGTLCAIDRQPRELSADHRQLLEDLASLVVDELELRKARREADLANEELRLRVAELLDTQKRLEIQATTLAALAEERAILSERLGAEVALKDRFFSIIAHDLRDPFTSLLGMSKMMSMGGPAMSAAKMSEYAQHIHESAGNVYRLLDELLEWARVQMTGQRDAPEVFDLSEIANENIAMMQALASGKAISLKSCAPSCPVKADRNMITLVVRNLVANAIKFTPRDGTISIDTQCRGNQVELSVTDTGVGVDPKLRDGLFALDTKTTTAGTNGEIGTGMGLPLSRQMVELNGGALDFEAIPTGGTRFFFTLPKAAGS